MSHLVREMQSMITSADITYFDGRIVKRVRKAMGITQKDLARRIGSFFYTISWIERNKLQPNDEILSALCEALGLTRDDFYTRTKPPVSPAPSM